MKRDANVPYRVGFAGAGNVSKMRLDGIQRLWFAVFAFLLAAAASAQKPSDKPLFRPALIRVLAQDINGKSLPNAWVQAYNPDCGIPVDAVKTNGDGRCQFNLFPGAWRFFVYFEAKGYGIFLSEVRDNLDGRAVVILRPTRHVSVIIASGAAPLDAGQVVAMDSRFSRWLSPRPIGPSLHGRFELLTSPGTPLVVLWSREPKNGTGFLLSGNVPDIPNATALALNAAHCARMHFEASAALPIPTKVNFEFVVVPLFSYGIPMTTALPADFLVTPGFVEMKYAYQATSGYDLVFLRNGYPMIADQTTPFRLGGPITCSIYHKFAPKFGDTTNVLLFHTFIRDAGGHDLFNVERSVAGKRSSAPVDIEARLGDQIVLSLSGNEPGHQFYKHSDYLSETTDLSRLEYRIGLPSEGGRRRVLKGHGIDLRKQSEHFDLEGPSELADKADSVLQASELAFTAFSRIMGAPPAWADLGQRCSIEFSPALDAAGWGWWRGWCVNCLTPIAQSHIARTIEWPLTHELGHAVGLAHEDYIGTICDQVDVAIPYGALCNRPGLLDFLRGKPLDEKDWYYMNDGVIRVQFGYEVINEALVTCRDLRRVLWSQGYPFVVVDCATFDVITGGKARRFYEASGVPIDPQKLKAAVAFIEPEYAKLKAISARTVDLVRPGSIASDRDHKMAGKRTKNGERDGHTCREALKGGNFQYEVKALPDQPMALLATYWGGDAGRVFDILVDGHKIATQRLQNNHPGRFYNEEYPLPEQLTTGKNRVTVTFQARPRSIAGGLHGLRMLRANP